MFHEPALKNTPWADNTYSQLHDRQLKSAFKRLCGYPKGTIFDLQGDISADAYWDISYDAQEHPEEKCLHSAKDLRTRVMLRLPQECQLLSSAEEELVTEMIQKRTNRMPVMLDDLPACESLVRRMWAHVEMKGLNIILCLPDEVFLALSHTMKTEQADRIIMRMSLLSATIAGYLYLSGTMVLNEAMSLFKTQVLLDEPFVVDQHLLMRYFMADFDYIYDSSGHMVLVHPGLAHPQDFLSSNPTMRPEPDSELVAWASENLLPQESDLCLRLMNLMKSEMSTEEAFQAALDIRLLIKQDAPVDEIHNALRNLLSMAPSEAIMDVFNDMLSHTPRWTTQTSALLQ